MNTFEARIKNINYTHKDWVKSLLDEYEETQKTFKETRDRLLKHANDWNEYNRKAIEDILLSKLDKHLRLTEAILLEEPPKVPEFPELTYEIQKKVDEIVAIKEGGQVIIHKFNLSIRKSDLLTLEKQNWLNDEVINFYVLLIEERNKNSDKLPKVHTFSTFFYINFHTRGYTSVKRWTKKTDIFNVDLILIPVHLTVHWCLAVIDFRVKEIRYYDSMGHNNNECLKHLANYLKAEHQDKKGSPFDMSEWKSINVKDIPQQMNGSDCGVFACTFAEYLARDALFNFGQKRMPYFRRKMIYEIASGELMKFS